MVRTVQLGPVDLIASDISPAFGFFYRTRFKIPKGGTVTYISISPPNATPPTWVSATMYQSRLLDESGFQGEKSGHALITDAYPWGGLGDPPHPAIWNGRHTVDDSFEYTLEILVFDGTGASVPTWKALIIVEVED